MHGAFSARFAVSGLTARWRGFWLLLWSAPARQSEYVVQCYSRGFQTAPDGPISSCSSPGSNTTDLTKQLGLVSCYGACASTSSPDDRTTCITREGSRVALHNGCAEGGETVKPFLNLCGAGSFNLQDHRCAPQFAQIAYSDATLQIWGWSGVER